MAVQVLGRWHLQPELGALGQNLLRLHIPYQRRCDRLNCGTHLVHISSRCKIECGRLYEEPLLEYHTRYRRVWGSLDRSHHRGAYLVRDGDEWDHHPLRLNGSNHGKHNKFLMRCCDPI